MKLDRSRIRLEKAKVSDVPDIATFLLKVVDQNALGEYAPPDYRKGVEELTAILENNEGAILTAVYDHPKWERVIVGVLVLAEYTPWWSKTRYFTNVVFSIHPLCRKYGLAKRMLEVAKIFAKNAGNGLILNLFDNSDKLEKTVKWFRANGFRNIGASLIYT